MAVNPVSFSPAVSYPVGSGPLSVAVGDFNRDGILDIVTANINDNTVSILLGHGDGTFTTLSPITVGSSPDAVAVGDFILTCFLACNRNMREIRYRADNASTGRQFIQSSTKMILESIER